MKPLVRRQKAVKATLDRFGQRPFAWGSADCVKLCAFHLRQLGHTVRLAGAGQYKSAIGAKAALKRKGFESVIEAVDALGLPRIAPAFALIGDIVSLPADDPLGGLCIFAGGDKFAGYHEAHPALVTMTPSMEALHNAIAWRVL